MTVRDSFLTANSATAEGGGIFNTLNFGVAVPMTVTGSTLAGNSALEGGAFYNDASGVLDLRGDILLGNTARDSGGGIYNAGTASVRDSILSGNSAASDGGGIFNDASGTLKLRDSVVWHNSAPLGGDLYNAGLVSLFDSVIGHRYDI